MQGMNEDCDEIRLLIQADLDGELRPAEAARIAAHLERCPRCAETQDHLATLSERVRHEASSYPASEEFRAALTARIAAAAPKPAVRRRSWMLGASFGAGFAVAASVALLLVPPRGAQWPDEIVASHIRALQPGHLMDVVSTDQHTVKPWFDGRLAFAPPVKDLAAIGFPLAGGRLDYLAGRPAAALVYRRAQHVIDLFAFAGTDAPGGMPGTGSRDGYNFIRWEQDGMSFWAVSDLNSQEMADFAREWRKA
jgi:anti-sigma factor (TIGR02949 family)